MKYDCKFLNNGKLLRRVFSLKTRLFYSRRDISLNLLCKKNLVGPSAGVRVLGEKIRCLCWIRNSIIQSVAESLYCICKQMCAFKYLTRLTSHVYRIILRFLVIILKLNNFVFMWNMSETWDDVVMVLRSSMEFWNSSSIENLYNFLLFHF